MVIKYQDNMDSTSENLENSVGFKAALDEAKQGASEGGV